MLKRGEGQSGEIRDLLARLDDAVEDVQSMQRQMDEVERKINSAINFQVPQQQPNQQNQGIVPQPSQIVEQNPTNPNIQKPNPAKTLITQSPVNNNNK